jgi:RNA recognition motif-containing protein
LYIKGLPLGSTEQTVHQIFGAYGAVTSCKVLSHVDGATTAAAMVRMGSVDQATWLVQNLNGNIPQGLTDAIQVKFANSGGGKGKAPDVSAWGTDGYGQSHPPVMGAVPPGAPSSWSTLAPPPPAAITAGKGEDSSPQDNLYIKGLPVGVTDELVREIFGAYGAVTSVRVLSTPEGADNAAALVRFNDVAQAMWLVDNLNGNIPKGLSGPVIVRYANPSGKGKGDAKGEGKDDRFSPYGKGGGGAAPAPLPINFGQGEEGSNLYIRGLPPTADDLYLYKVFAPVGAILSVKAIVSLETSQCAGYGFVKYATAEEAQKAIALLSSTPLPDGNMLMVTVKSPGKGKGKDKSNGGAYGAPQYAVPQPPLMPTSHGGMTDFAALAASDPEAAAALKALSS